jgi:DNA-directed RNA polymerase subunit RPC12/RpoP
VELQVPENEVDRARNIMIETGETDVPARVIACPKCSSQDVGLKMNFGTHMQLFFKTIAGALTLKTPDLEGILQTGKYKCKNCGEEFK